MDEIAVSVICNTYNHEKYIETALESFVKQKTSFKYEILVHDDASTDGTASIIQKYEQKYPDKILPIYQTENQYSQGNGLVNMIQYARVRGKYIAVCEGDDYWTDPLKLQKQYDAMEQHPELDICSHGALVLDAVDNKIVGKVKPSKNNCIFSVPEIILGGGGFVTTASLFYRAELNKTIPDFRSNLPLDYTLQIHGALHGGMMYLADVMSVYRVNVNGSWTHRMSHKSEQMIQHLEKIKKMFLELDRYTEHKYADIIKRQLQYENFRILEEQRDYKAIIKHPWFRKLGCNKKAKIFVKSILKYKLN